MKKITLVSVLLLYLNPFNSYGQFTSVWSAVYQHTTSPGYSNEGRKVAVDPAGNIFILSDNTSDIDPNGIQGAVTYNYITISKYSTTGSLLNSLAIEVYNHVISGFELEGVFGLNVDAAGDVYIGFTSYDAITGYDVAIGKYDNDLNRIWLNYYITNGDEKGIDFKIDGAGTIYALVKTVDTQAHYSIIQSVPFSAPPILIIDFPGNIVTINSFDIDENQTAYVGGYIYKGGYRDAYIGAVDVTNGSILWGSFYSPKGIMGDEIITQVTIGVDGNIYSTGTSFQGAAGNCALVTKNQPGNPKFDFVKILRGQIPNISGCLINATESGWVYVGASALTDASVYVFRIPDDGIYSYPGMIQYLPEPSMFYTAINSIRLNDMKVSSSQCVYITGGIAATGPVGDFNCSYMYKSRVVFGNALIDDGGMPVDGQFSLNYEGVALALDYSKSDVYWLRNLWDDTHANEAAELTDINIPAPLRKSIQDSETHSISLSPNPASTIVEVAFNETIKDVEIFDVAGNRVLYATVESVMTRLNVSELASGYYIVKANTEVGTQMKPLIIKQ